MIYEAATEKAPVIFDFGKKYTKCGFAGEPSPRCIIPSEVKQFKTGEIFKLSSNTSEQCLYDGLCDFIYSLYMNKLLVNPKERRVILVENIFSSTKFRNTLGQVFFKHFEVPSIYFGLSHVFSVFTVGQPTCLVVDCGFDNTVIVPVVEYTPIIKACETVAIAGDAIHKNLEAILKETAVVKAGNKEKSSLSSYMEEIDEYCLEDIKVRGCFVNRMDRVQKLIESKLDPKLEAPKEPPGFDYPLSGEIVIHISGKVRETACEILFDSKAKDSSITSCMIEAILNSPLDSRKKLCESIILMGGTCMLAGFKDRLSKELTLLVDSEYASKMGVRKFKFHSPPSKENYTAWLGGAIFGTTDIVGMRSMSLEAYNNLQRIPDWCNLLDLDNIRKEMLRLQQQPKVYRSQRMENIRNTASTLLVPISKRL